MKSEIKESFDKILEEAREAALKASIECIPEPMQMMGSIVRDGVCGFAWVNIPGRGNFAKYAKEYLGASKNYGGKGFNIWYSEFYKGGTQSYERHLAACRAASEVLQKHGIKSQAAGRLD